MVWRLPAAKPLPESMLAYQLHLKEQLAMKLESKFDNFDSNKYDWKYRRQNFGNFIPASMC